MDTRDAGPVGRTIARKVPAFLVGLEGTFVAIQSSFFQLQVILLL